jgi:hypothetical protein
VSSVLAGLLIAAAGYLIWAVRWLRHLKLAPPNWIQVAAKVSRHYWLPFTLGALVAASLAFSVDAYLRPSMVVSAQPVSLPPDSLVSAVDTFLAKKGKIPKWNRDASGPPTVGLATLGAPDVEFISVWDYASLGPWPTEDDGFNRAQLYLLPKKLPNFKLQSDRENFRIEVGALQKILNQRIGSIVRLSQSLASISPTPENGNEFQIKLSQISEIYQEVDGLLFVRGSSGNGTFFDDSSYKDLLMGVLPDDWQVQWVNYKVTLSEFKKALAFMQGAQRHPEDAELVRLANMNMGIPKDQFLQQTGRLRDWLTRTNQSIDLLISAI